MCEKFYEKFKFMSKAGKNWTEYLLSNGMLTRVGIAVDDWAKPKALAKFLALTFS